MAKISVVYPNNHGKNKKSLGRKILELVLLVGGIGGFITFIDFLNEKSKSPGQKDFEQRFATGILLPPRLLASDSDIVFFLGYEKSIGAGYPISELKKGVEFIPDMFGCKTGDNPLRLKFQIQENRLFVSDTIINLQDEEIIGWIDFNVWQIRNDKKLKISEDDTYLEIVDNQGLIPLSLKFVYPNIVQIQGYFIGEMNAGIAGEGYMPCVPKSDAVWKDVIRRHAKLITPVAKQTQ